MFTQNLLVYTHIFKYMIINNILKVVQRYFLTVRILRELYYTRETIIQESIIKLGWGDFLQKHASYCGNLGITHIDEKWQK